MQISKFHKALRYIRRPLCFLVVIAIVSIYILSDSAFAYVAAGDQSFISRFGIDTSVQNYAFYYRYGKARYDAEGHNSANLFSLYNNPIRTGWNGTLGSWWFDWFNAYTYASTVEIDGITYDLTNAYVIADSGDSWVDANGRGIKWIVSEGYVCLANQYVVSESPFHFIYSDSGGTTRVVNVTSTENNGLYFLNLPSYAFGNQDYTIGFTSLDVFMSSSDGESGFTTITTESTDLDLSSDELFNFNNIKYDGLIINSGDPSLDPEVEEVKGQYYNYAYVDGYIRPTSATDIAVNLTFSFNDYMRLHPNEYEIRFQWYATLTGNNLPSAYGSNYFETENSLPLSTITGYNGWNQGGNNTQFRYATTVNSLKNSSNKSLQDAFEEIYILRGGSSSTYNEFSIIDFVIEYYTGYSNATVGKWNIRGNFTNILTKITLGCKINIVWVGGEPEQTGGKLWITYDTDNGSSIVSNDIGVNYNPPSEPDPSYPAEIKDSNGNVIVNSGGSNITVNPTTYANFNAVIEYLFNLDASDLNNIAGNTHNAIQTVINSMSDTSSNGFLGVLTETYSYIPDPIWNWIKTAVAVICGGAVIGWVFRVGRVRNGG